MPWTTDPRIFLKESHWAVQEGEADGLWHVTVARDAVVGTGRLLSRQELRWAAAEQGTREYEGLGGGGADVAVDRVSLTWSRTKALVLKQGLKFAIEVAKGQHSAADILDWSLSLHEITADEIGRHDRTARVLHKAGINSVLFILISAGNPVLQGREEGVAGI